MSADMYSQEVLTMLESSTEEIASAFAAAIGGFAAMGLIVLLFQFIFFGTLTYKLAHRKGYKGYFWTGAFLGFIGLIYVVGLPDNRRRRHRSSEDAE
ncbi:MAG: hypothetical protein E7335_09885 [Clostridiales bacterium]|nr:hypothetical protein [Clostridiales bacterium]